VGPKFEPKFLKIKPSIEPILGPIKDPNITKYKDIVTAGGTKV